MTPTTSIEVIARSILWIFVFSFEVLVVYVVGAMPSLYWFYVAAIVMSTLSFIVIATRVENSALTRDMRELCFYDMLVMWSGLALHFLDATPLIFYALCEIVVMLKFVRLFWQGRRTDGRGLAAWPVFGVLGLLAKARRSADVGTWSGASRRHDALAYATMVMIVVVMALAYPFKLPVPTLSFWAAVAIGLIALYHKRFFHYLHTQEAVHSAAVKALAVAETTAAANVALAAANAELSAKNAALLESNRQRDVLITDIKAKNAILRDAAHDLKQPIAPIYSQAERVIREPDFARRAVLGKALLRRVLDFSHAIEDTIYVTKIETQVAPAKIVPVSVAEKRDSLLQELSDFTQRYDVLLKVRLSGGGEDFLIATDDNILSVILANLVRNAVFHSEGNIVLVTFRKRGENCIVAVHDNGRGIMGVPTGPDDAANFAAYIAHMHERTHSGRQGKGDELGMSNVNQLCAAIGSTMMLRSTMAAGSVFYFVVPLTVAVDLRALARSR